MALSKFSVLMPVYFADKPKLLDKAINSVFKNTICPNYLYLIIDGKISTNLNLVILKYKKIYNSKIRIYKLKKNLGLSYALNFGLKKIREEIVIRADADDINMKSRFVNLLNKISNGYDIVGSNITEYVNSKKNFLKKVPLIQADIASFIKYRNPFNHMSVAFRKSKILKLGGYPSLHFFEDYALWAKAIRFKFKVANLDKSLVKVFIDNNFYKRRGGLKYLIHIINFQKFLLDQEVISKKIFFFNCVVRVFFAILSSTARSFFYKRLLRK
jgi:glycosyltransferase involved in cell wall biosynthesis